MQKTVMELNGTVCIELEEIAPPKKQILSSRSFGQSVGDYNSLAESITLYMSRAAEKLRKQNSCAGSVFVYIRTSPFKPDEPQYSNGLTIPLPIPTDDTRQLVKVALWALKRIYRVGFRYAKAGVMLGELVSVNQVQPDFFAKNFSESKENLMGVLDAVNKKMGRGTMKLASEGFKKPW
jgi:DNA polymerase V